MSENGHVNGKAPIVEGPGRYVVFQAPDGGWIVARAVGICETCQNCKCGEQAPAVQIPAMVISLAQSGGFSMDMLRPSKMRALMKAARNGG